MRGFAVLTAWTALLASSSAGADPAYGPTWTVDGYATLGIVHSGEDRADYHPSLLKPDGPGASGSWDMELDSVAAVQLGYHPTARLSAVVQVVSEDSFHEPWEPKLEWANVRYEASPNVAVRVGRTELDTFLVSSHRKVGYALPWVRPPAELYRIMSIANSDGIDVGFRSNHENLNYSGRISYGENGIDEANGVIRADEIWAISNTLEWGPATLHAAYQRSLISSPFSDPFFAAFEPFGAAGDAVQRRYDPTGKWMTFTALGASYDPGDWFVMGEWGRGDSRSITGEGEAWYVTGGRRWGRFTPYVTFAKADRVHDLDVAGLPVDAYPMPVALVAAELNATLAAARRAGPEQQTLTLGVRCDLMRNTALKLQYDYVDVDDDSPGTFDNLEPGFQPSGTNLFSFTIDVIF